MKPAIKPVKILVLCIFAVILSVSLYPLYSAYEQIPVYGYLVDCIDGQFQCGDETCDGSQINPGIDEGGIEGGCYNTFDDNCNNAEGAWDNDIETGKDCKDPACIGKQGPGSKICCRTDNDCSSINPGNCGEAYCDTENNLCETRIIAQESQQQTCNSFIGSNNYECAASPSEGRCSSNPGFPYNTYTCNILSVNQLCNNADSCSAEHGRDCSCNPSTFQCSTNLCSEAQQEREQDPNSLVYCYSECITLEHVSTEGEPVNPLSCPFNEKFNLGAFCTQ